MRCKYSYPTMYILYPKGVSSDVRYYKYISCKYNILILSHVIIGPNKPLYWG